jgi:hypothetical protein
VLAHFSQQNHTPADWKNHVPANPKYAYVCTLAASNAAINDAHLEQWPVSQDVMSCRQVVLAVSALAHTTPATAAVQQSVFSLLVCFHCWSTERSTAHQSNLNLPQSPTHYQQHIATQRHSAPNATLTPSSHNTPEQQPSCCCWTAAA